MSDQNFMPEGAVALDDDPVVLPIAPESQDIDAISWLGSEAERAKEVGFFEIDDGRRLRIAPITEAEDNLMLRQSRRPNKASGGKIEVDMILYRRRYIALSLTKGDPGHPVDEAQLNGALSGTLSRLFKAIFLLSGGESTKPELPDPFGFST